MNKKNLMVVFSIIGFLAGLVFFCTYQEWLVIYWHKPSHHKQATSVVEKKNITLWREKNSDWIKESFQILWAESNQENFKLLTTTWLAWLYDESILSKKIKAESVLFSPSGYEMYVSFDHNPFEKNWSIHQKESFISALLKNYKEQGCAASLLYILVRHEPLQDIHLDFSEPWPLAEFSL